MCIRNSFVNFAPKIKMRKQCVINDLPSAVLLNIFTYLPLFEETSFTRQVLKDTTKTKRGESFQYGKVGLHPYLRVMEQYKVPCQTRDMSSVSLVNREWYSLISHDYLWRNQTVELINGLKLENRTVTQYQQSLSQRQLFLRITQSYKSSRDIRLRTITIQSIVIICFMFMIVFSLIIVLIYFRFI
jgi:hypothetical protein